MTTKASDMTPTPDPSEFWAILRDTVAALKLARKAVESWGEYARICDRIKHDLAFDLAVADLALEVASDALAEQATTHLPVQPAIAAPVEAAADAAADWDFKLWIVRLMKLADEYHGASTAGKARYRDAVYVHASNAGMHWRARAFLARPTEAAKESAMTKYSYEWFVAQSRAAQESVREWPETMRKNIRVGVATLPVLGEGGAREGRPTEATLGGAPEGWALYSADFSRNTQDPLLRGRVVLTRDPAGTKWWHGLSEAEREETDLYVTGYGYSFDDALKDAALAAAPTAIQPSAKDAPPPTEIADSAKGST